MLEETTYGYNEKAEAVLEEIQNNPRGIDHNSLINKIEISESKARVILAYLKGKGSIIQEGGGTPGSTRRYFSTPNKELEIDDYRNQNLRKQFTDALNEVKEESGRDGNKYRVIVQQVE